MASNSNVAAERRTPLRALRAFPASGIYESWRGRSQAALALRIRTAGTLVSITGLLGAFLTDTIEKMRKRIELNIYYIQRWSLQLDLRIFLRTALHGWTGASAC